VVDTGLVAGGHDVPECGHGDRRDLRAHQFFVPVLKQLVRGDGRASVGRHSSQRHAHQRVQADVPDVTNDNPVSVSALPGDPEEFLAKLGSGPGLASGHEQAAGGSQARATGAARAGQCRQRAHMGRAAQPPRRLPRSALG